MDYQTKETPLLQFIKENIVPTHLQSIEDIVSKVLLERLLKYIQEVDPRETWEHILFNQFLFEPSTDIYDSDIIEYYGNKFSKNTEVIKRFSELVLDTGINSEVMRRVTFGGF